jgi:hypothetical protein
VKITSVTSDTLHPGWRKNLTEYFLPLVAFGDKVSPNQLKPKNGYIELPTAPGLGVDINEGALAGLAGKTYPLRALRHPKDEGP